MRWLGWVALAGLTMSAAAQPGAGTQAKPAAAERIAMPNAVLERVLREWPEGKISTVKDPGEWSYEEGVLLDGMLAEWHVTGDGRLFAYVQAAVDRSVDEHGTIHFAEGRDFPVAAHSLDNIEMGRATVEMYRVLQQPRYYEAASFLRQQVLLQPKNASGGYWHKQIYPNQMWLDGAYMAEPFMAAYARTFHVPGSMDEVATQLLLMDAHMRDKQTGLLRHGWDESLKMDWADRKTGLSPEVWSRAMGWYVMALVDVLEQMPESNPQRAALGEAAGRALTAVARYQDPGTGLWWQVMDKGGAKNNYLEASASCMFVYAMAKGIRLGVFGEGNDMAVQRGWNGIQARFVKPDGTLSGTVKVAGLGGTPYRSGTYDYYTGEAVGDNDAKGVGAYLLALSEITQRQRIGDVSRRARGKTVLVDAWFNSQMRKNADGQMELYHYKWDDSANSGYSAAARMFQQYGMRTEMLDHAPRADDLKGVEIYVIVSPDIPAVNPQPHYMDRESAEVIEAWVKAGGVLVEMENDSEHADQAHFDLLSDRFGLHFNDVTRNRELNGSYDNTIVPIPAGAGGIFHEAHRALEKETCTLTLFDAARPVVTDRGDVMMAVSHAGKGVVFANVVPWIYNEYTDGRKTPAEEDNFAGGLELVHWLVVQAMIH